MLVTKTIEIDMGHRVPNHKSKCKNLHGHRYKIEVGVDGHVIQDSGSSDEGMVIDFGDLKEIMMDVIDKDYDHSFIMWSGDDLSDQFALWKGEFTMKIVFVDFIPTAENLAKWWWILLKNKLLERKIKINHVTVFETPTSTATYKE